MKNSNKKMNRSNISWPEPIGSQKGNSKSVKSKLRLDKKNGKLMGVCSGFANWTGVDVNIWRIGFVLAALFSIGAPILIYLLIGLIVD